MPRTTLEALDEHARQIEALIEELLEQHSGIDVFRNDPHSSVVAFGANSWRKPDQPGRQLQSRILRELERYDPLVHVLLRGAPAAVTQEAAEASETIRNAVDQSAGTYSSVPRQVIEEVADAFAFHREQLASLYDPAPGEHVYVPDANAIIWNPDLEEWSFDDSPRFSIVLTSTLLGEIDMLKTRDSVREKAESAARRIKEYGRRGDIGVGVPLKRDRSTVRSIAVEPNFDGAPAWLDSTVKDDRLIASVLEVVREHPHSPVVLVTRDVGMQNKARHAGIPFVEPPDPMDAAPKARRPLVDMRVLQIEPQGGASDWVSFVADVQYGGTKPTRATYQARVGDVETPQCYPPHQDMVANHIPWQVTVQVPRPSLGTLVKELNDATTLYGDELVLEVSVDGDVVAEGNWSEPRYDPFTDAARARIQKFVWEDRHRERMAEFSAARLKQSQGPH